MSTPKGIEIGDIVTCREPTHAYYSRYAGNAECILQPGDEAIVKHLDVPSVHREGVSFTVVDFDRPGVYMGNPKHNNTLWRAALLNDNIKLVRKADGRSD